MDHLKHLKQILSITVISCLAFSSMSEAADQSKYQDEKRKSVKKSQGNLNFDVPEDWPIEERNGILGPVPIEEYLALKFDDIEKQFTKVDQNITNVNARIKVIEDQLKRPRKLREGEAEDVQSKNESEKV